MADSQPTSKPAVNPGAKPPQNADVSATLSPAQQSIETSLADIQTKPPTRAGKAAPDLSVPEIFGRYRIEKELGKGAMGVVYLAEDTQLHRKVALKIPRKSVLEEPEALERFYREARTTATLRHNNICPVYDVGDIDGTHYLTMAFIPGKPISSFLGKKLPPAKQVALLIRKIALALEEAHRNGVVHRDLKPSNVMLDDRGEPVVMDFGLARNTNTAENARLTQSGAILGTPAYMAPEQVRGETDAIGPRSDIYALGVMMYQFLTGELPFSGPIMMVFAQILTNSPKKPSELKPDVDPALEAICLKMMAKDAGQRYGSMKEVAAALSEYIKTGTNSGLQPTVTMAPAVPWVEPEPSFENLAEFPDVVVAPLKTRKRKAANSQATGGAGWWNRWRHSSWFLPGVAGLGGLPVVIALWWAAVIFFDTGEGTVMIEVADPDIQVRFADQTITIDAPMTEPITVRARKQTLLIDGPGFTADSKSFTLKRGDVKRLTVSLINGKPHLEETSPEAPLEAGVPETEDDAEEQAKQLTAGKSPAAKPAENGAIDLLAQIDLNTHTQGRWLKNGENFLVGFGGGEKRVWSRLRPPIKPAGSYELEVAFQLGRIPPEAILFLNLPVKDRAVTFGCSPLNPKATALVRIRQRGRPELRPGDNTLHQEIALRAEREYRLIASVQVNSDQADVLISLDGAPWVSWSGPVADLSPAKHWPESAAHALGLDLGVAPGKKGVATMIVSALRYRELSGGETVSQKAFPAGAVYTGTWRLFRKGQPAPDSVRRCQWTVLKRDGDTFEADFMLREPDEHWINKGQVTDRGSGNGTLVAREMYEVAKNHRPVAGYVVEAEITEGGKSIRATTRVESGARSEIEATLVNRDTLSVANGAAKPAVVALTQFAKLPSDFVFNTAVSPDGKLVAGGNNNSTKVWDAATGGVVSKLQIDGQHAPRTLTFTPDNKYLAWGGWNQELHLYDAKTGAKFRTFQGNDSFVVSLCFSSDGKRLLSGSQGRKVGQGFSFGLEPNSRIWNMETGELLRKFDGGNVSVGGRWLADGRRAVAHAGSGSLVRLWDTETGREELVYGRDLPDILDMALSSHDKYVAAGLKNDVVLVWDVTSGKQVQRFEPAGRPVFTPDGERILCSAKNGASLRLWDVKTGAELLRVEQNLPDGIGTIHVFPQGDRALVSTYSSGHVYTFPLTASKTTAAITSSLPDATSAADGIKTVHGGGDEWRFTLTKPGGDWNSIKFDASAWQTGKSPFGIGWHGQPFIFSKGLRAQTEWKSKDIWLRKEIEAPADIAKRKVVWNYFHDEDLEVYVNGKLLLKRKGWAKDYQKFIEEPGRTSLTPGRNAIAVHCHNTGGPDCVDVGVRWQSPEK